MSFLYLSLKKKKGGGGFFLSFRQLQHFQLLSDN